MEITKATVSVARSRHGKRHVPGQMNKTEAEYADILHARVLAKEVVSWEFEAFKIRLALRCWYTLDFFVVLADGSIEVVDVKGGGPIEDDALVKIKAASESYWMFKFVIEQKTKDGWQRREF